MAGRGKGKLNKVKRGGPRRFTEPEDIFGGEPKANNSDSDQESGSEEEIKAKAPPPSKKQQPQKKAIGRSDDTSEDEGDSEPDVFPVPKDYGKPLPEPEPPVAKFESMNINRAAAKNVKASELSTSEDIPMSRREREALEKERAKAAFWKAQMEGKTEQARNDLARLAIIKKQREEAARKKAEELAAKSTASGAKSASMAAGKATITKALGK
ncbi:heat- and acid-stable phosphoprotein [Blyttiomyces sp. JEL0837]|nr:heat- and acid-stable phosphoprotein [Blyttiomyces sp. JEL0837]